MSGLRLAIQLLPLMLLMLSCGGRERQLIILHTNDIHAWFAPRPERLADGREVQLGGAPVLATLIREYREQNPGMTLYLEGGDLFQGTPISNLTEGQACIEVMNLLAPDVAVAGNHEFDYGMEAQRLAFDRAAYPIIQANVRRVGRAQPYLPSDITVNRGGLQVAILGLNTDELFGMADPAKLGGVRVDSSRAVAEKWLERVARADLKVILSHRGFRADSLLALALPGIDLIVGAHSHTVLEHPVQVGGAWIVQAGDQGRYLGVDTLYVKPGKGIRRIAGGLVPVTAEAAEPAADVAALVSAQEAEVNKSLGEQVAVLTAGWTRSREGESNIGNWLCAALRKETGAEIGLWNSGGIRKDLPAGPVTLRDIWEISPFGNEVVVAPVSGAALRRLFTREHRQGGVHMQFDGLRIGRDETGAPGVFLVDGVPMEEPRRYRVAMTDYVWGQIREEADSLTAATRTGLIDRDLLIKRARAEKEITPVLDGRWGPGEARAGR